MSDNKTWEQYVNNQGQIGVLVSGGFGAGWSTWNTFDKIDNRQLLMDKRLVEKVLQNEHKSMCEDDVKELLELPDDANVYCGGLADCYVEWLNKGEQFRINEYDGSESLETFHEDNYYIV